MLFHHLRNYTVAIVNIENLLIYCLLSGDGNIENLALKLCKHLVYVEKSIMILILLNKMMSFKHSAAVCHNLV